SLRERHLVVTRRGRNGGSFVVETANVAEFALRALRDISRVALRDLAAHYLAVTGACVGLAAQRADPSEVLRIRSRLDRYTGNDPLTWRRLADDAHLEISALSQSARLTREQMRLQAEFSPFLALVDASEADRERSRSQLLAVLDAVSAADSATATRQVRESIADAMDRLIDRQAELARS
ncbi:FCD domain-containing protein, partial [Cryobacterium sp. TMT3-29-2]|uniref:FCD domain-containing protein n=1 Tax=Cryobacterium sp. TMT3-29-2 TaxID=2555867 RepID=UPI001073A996